MARVSHNSATWYTLSDRDIEKLRETRVALGLTLQNVLDETGISRQTLSKIENSRQKHISIEDFEKLCTCYNVDVNSFDLRRENEPKQTTPSISKIKKSDRRYLQMLTDEDLLVLARYHALSDNSGRIIFDLLDSMSPDIDIKKAIRMTRAAQVPMAYCKHPMFSGDGNWTNVRTLNILMALAAADLPNVTYPDPNKIPIPGQLTVDSTTSDPD